MNDDQRFGVNDDQPLGVNDDQPTGGDGANLKPWHSPILRSISLRRTEGGQVTSYENASGVLGS